MNSGDDTHTHEHGDDGGTAVADKGQGQTDDRYHAETDTNIDNDLEEQHAGDTDADNPVHVIAGLNAHIDTTDYNGSQQQQNYHTTQHTQLLSNR